MIRKLIDKGVEYLVISVFLTSFISFVGWLYKDNIQEFFETPQRLAAIELAVGDLTEPKLVEVMGPALVLEENKTVKLGQPVSMGFTLRRNASCDSDIEAIFINVDTGIEKRIGVSPSVRAPVTEDLIFFRLDISTVGLGEGKWVYFPRIIPKECGVYESYRIPASEVFTIEG